MTDFNEDGTSVMGTSVSREICTDQLPAHSPVGPPKVFNPLDAQPVQFKQLLQQRQENYEALADHLRGMLVPYKDFGRVHVAKNCNDKYDCTNPYHYSPDTLFAPGADKILGILGLGCEYPDEEDYRRATLKGIEIKEVILKAYVVDMNGRSIAQGTAAATTKEHQGSLHNTIQKAEKRARLDAVKRLPGISSLFEDGTLSTVGGGQNTAEGRAAVKEGTRPKASSDKRRETTGAILVTMPFGRHKGERFTDLSDEYLQWAARLDDKPDIAAAAEREIMRRSLQDTETIDTPAPKPPPHAQKPQNAQKAPAAAEPELPDDWAGTFDDLEDPQFRSKQKPLPTIDEAPDDDGRPPLESYFQN